MDRIRLIHRLEDGDWWAESPDVPEWFATADTYDQLHCLAEGIRFALERGDVTIEHFVPSGSATTLYFRTSTGPACRPES